MATASATAVLILLALVALVLPATSPLSDGSPGAWAVDDRDDQAFVMAAAVTSYRQPEGPPRIFLVGTSLMREAFGGPGRTAAVIRETAGRDVEVVPLAAGGNTAMHMLALLATASQHRGGIAVIGLNELALGVSERERCDLIERVPIGLVVWQARSLARARCGKALNVDAFGPLHALNFYRARLRSFADHIWQGKRIAQATQFPFEKRADGALPAIPLDRLKSRVARYLAEADRNGDSALADLRAMLEPFWQRDDMKIVLLLDPLDARLFDDPILSDQLARSRRRIEAFAQAHGLELVASVREAANSAGGFVDYGHIAREKTREQLRLALARSLTAAVRRAR